MVGPVPVGRLVLDQTTPAGDDGFHQLEDGGLESGVVLGPPRPAAEDAAEDEGQVPFLARGKRPELEKGAIEAGPEGLPGPCLLRGPHQGRQFVLVEQDRGNARSDVRREGGVAQPPLGVSRDGIADGLEGPQVAVDGLAPGVEARRQLVDRGSPALFQDPQEGEESHHLSSGTLPSTSSCG